MPSIRAFTFLTVLLSLVAGLPIAAAAQDKLVQRRDAFRDWAVFVDDSRSEKVCFAASVPTESRATRGGTVVNVRRGDIYLLVSTFPSEKVTDELSVKLGYPTDTNKVPTIDVDNKTFKMFGNDEELWMPSPSDDTNVVDAMKKGSVAIVKAVSRRGTLTTDRYSLLGFTAALERVKELCSE